MFPTSLTVGPIPIIKLGDFDLSKSPMHLIGFTRFTLVIHAFYYNDVHSPVQSFILL